MEIGAVTYGVITGIFAAGAAVGTVKAAVNGAKKKIDEIHDQLHSHISEETHNDKETHARIASLETKVDFVIDNLQ